VTTHRGRSLRIQCLLHAVCLAAVFSTCSRASIAKHHHKCWGNWKSQTMLCLSAAAIRCMQMKLSTLALRSKLLPHLDFQLTIRGSCHDRLPAKRFLFFCYLLPALQYSSRYRGANTHLEWSLERVQHQGWGTPRSCPASHKLTGLLHRCALSASDQLISASTISNLSRQRS